MKILIIDNYDSFTYNLVHQVQQFTSEYRVFRNDEIEIERIAEYDKILISPGPGLPKDNYQLVDIIHRYGSTKSIFGICLGMQAIAIAYGGSLKNLDIPKHGESSTCILNGSKDYLWSHVENSFVVGHYHSWVIDETHLPVELEVTLKNDEGLVMAIRHRKFDVRGVQFHPESILTPLGKQIIFNWLEASEIEL